MERLILHKLRKWQENNNRKPLLIRGARQVGKSYSIKEFGETYFPGDLFSFNFERDPGLSKIFEENLDSNRILRELELVGGKRIIPGQSLVFFDEIQDCPKAIASLRYFYEEQPELHVIAAGSLLEFGMREISVPVGRIQTLVMQPMNFVEFLWAIGKVVLADRILNVPTEFSSTEIEIINKELESYFLVGGMPECVKAFLENESYQAVVEIQKDLLILFRQDFSKYGGYADKRCLTQVMNGVAKGVGNQIKYTHLSQEFSQPTIKKAFELLELARLLTRIESAAPDGIPLRSKVNSKRFKSIFLDIGLLSNINGYYQTVEKSNLSADFRGMMAEQFVGQELRYHFDDQVYYWSREKRGSSAETDYLIERENQIIPIEVKSGKSGRITSLHLLLSSHPNIKRALVFTEDRQGGIPDLGIQFWPLFAVCQSNVCT